MAVRTFPILMRNDNHVDVKVGNAQYNDARDVITFRVDVGTGVGSEFHLLGKAMDLGLVEGLNLRMIVPENLATLVEPEENGDEP